MTEFSVCLGNSDFYSVRKSNCWFVLSLFFQFASWYPFEMNFKASGSVISFVRFALRNYSIFLISLRNQVETLSNYFFLGILKKPDFLWKIQKEFCCLT